MDEIVALELLESLADAECNAQALPRPIATIRNPIDELSNREFIKIFRVSKELFNFITITLSPYLKPARAPKDIDVAMKVLIALKFFASGSYQGDIGNNWFLGVSQPSVSRCIQEVAIALNHPRIFNEYVKLPSNFQELNHVRSKFYQKFSFPGVIGCIDCTHIAIFPPEVNDPQYPEHLYINRKGYHSINVQLVCDANLKILNINAKYPGSTHDSFIWQNSKLNTVLRNIHAHGHTDYFLIGDSGYALRPWLMVPYNNPDPNSPQQKFNNKQKTVRTTVEHCNGVLKTRFRCCLKHRVLHYKPEKACIIINACAVLHNLCIMHNILLEDELVTDNFNFGMYNTEPLYEDEIRHVNNELLEGRRARSLLVNRYFT